MVQERPPFDPTRIRPPAPEPDAGGPGSTPLSVRQVNELVRGALAQHVPSTLHVLGEIGDLSRPASGHLYFSLKDPHSELRCVMWRSAAARLKFELQPGMEVVATGGLEVYTPRGSYQLMVRKLEPRGVGALELAFRQLRERLERAGLFAADRKRPLPRIPERVAVVTSPSGAAIRDILHTVRRRYPALEILVFPVRVQGEGAAEEIAAAIRALNQHADALGGIDVAIVGRGGGSLEDLWAFNEEVVARAIAASRIPIVSAVGHEVDVTISDLVADVRAPTPTAAAELVTPTLAELLEWLERQTRRAARSVTHAVQLARGQLTATLAYTGLARPQTFVGERSQLLDELGQRLRLALMEASGQARARLDAARQALLRYRSGVRFVEAGRALDRRLHRALRTLNDRALAGERGLARRLARVGAAAPGARLERYGEHLRQTRARVAVAARLMLAHRRRLFVARLGALTACDPRRVLQRGYSITRDARTRKVIRSIDQIRDKLRIITELADGEFQATADDPRQPGLFE